MIRWLYNHDRGINIIQLANFLVKVFGSYLFSLLNVFLVSILLIKCCLQELLNIAKKKPVTHDSSDSGGAKRSRQSGSSSPEPPAKRKGVPSSNGKPAPVAAQQRPGSDSDSSDSDSDWGANTTQSRKKKKVGFFWTILEHLLLLDFLQLSTPMIFLNFKFTTSIIFKNL